MKRKRNIVIILEFDGRLSVQMPSITNRKQIKSEGGRIFAEIPVDETNSVAVKIIDALSGEPADFDWLLDEIANSVFHAKK